MQGAVGSRFKHWLFCIDCWYIWKKMSIFGAAVAQSIWTWLGNRWVTGSSPAWTKNMEGGLSYLEQGTKPPPIARKALQQSDLFKTLRNSSARQLSCNVTYFLSMFKYTLNYDSNCLCVVASCWPGIPPSSWRTKFCLKTETNCHQRCPLSGQNKWRIAGCFRRPIVSENDKVCTLNISSHWSMGKLPPVM